MLFYFIFCNSEVLTSFPHNLVLDTQPRFGLTQSEFLNNHNVLINLRIFMKIAARCSAFINLSYKVHLKVCYLISLNVLFNYFLGVFLLFLFVYF